MSMLTEYLSNVMDTGTIGSLPLQQTDGASLPLEQGQTWKDLERGIYPVNGGSIVIGKTLGSHVAIILGITVNDMPINFMGEYVEGAQFNKNFSNVLYEMKKAGVSDITPKKLDHIHTPNSRGNDGLFWKFISNYRESVGEPARLDRIKLSDAFIKNISK